MAKQSKRDAYVERVRNALTLSTATELSNVEYLDALEELAGDIQAMIDAKREEMDE